MGGVGRDCWVRGEAPQDVELSRDAGELRAPDTLCRTLLRVSPLRENCGRSSGSASSVFVVARSHRC